MSIDVDIHLISPNRHCQDIGLIEALMDRWIWLVLRKKSPSLIRHDIGKIIPIIADIDNTIIISINVSEEKPPTIPPGEGHGRLVGHLTEDSTFSQTICLVSG